MYKCNIWEIDSIKNKNIHQDTNLRPHIKAEMEKIPEKSGEQDIVPRN